MKIKILALFIAVSFNYINAQQDQFITWNDYGVEGKVLKITEKKYNASEQNYKVKKEGLATGSEIVFPITKVEFSKDGNVRYITYSHNEKTYADSLRFYYTNNLLDSLKKYTFSNMSTEHFRYREEDQKLAEKRMYINENLINKWQYSYYEQGKNARVKVWDGKNAQVSYKKVVFNEQNKLLKDSIFLVEPKSLIRASENYYDNMGRLVRKKVDNPAAGGIAQEFYEYNEHDELKSVRKTNPDQSILYEYEWDKKGNWVKRIEKIDGKTRFISERMYVYY